MKHKAQQQQASTGSDKGVIPMKSVTDNWFEDDTWYSD
jgi:hypothetical protein